MLSLMARNMNFELRTIAVLGPATCLPALRLTRPDEGEEVYMSYGPHPNDFLFAECKH